MMPPARAAAEAECVSATMRRSVQRMLVSNCGELVGGGEEERRSMAARARSRSARPLLVRNDVRVGRRRPDAASVVSVRSRHGRFAQAQIIGCESDGLPLDELWRRRPRLVFGLGVTGTPLNLTVRWPGPTWRTQVIDDDAALEAAIGSMERPLVVVEPA